MLEFERQCHLGGRAFDRRELGWTRGVPRRPTKALLSRVTLDFLESAGPHVHARIVATVNVSARARGP